MQIREAFGREGDVQPSCESPPRERAYRDAPPPSPVHRLQSIKPTNRVHDHEPETGHWDPSLVYSVTKKICWEIMQTLNPVSAWRYLHREQNSEDVMISLFNMAAG
jgi:hypothetical protein